jgi:acyl carrier protein
MGLDSVELILAWEEAFDVSISDAEAGALYTPRQAVELIFNKVKSAAPEDSGCLAMRAFLQLRRAFRAVGIQRRDVRPDSKLSTLFPGRQRRDILNSVRERAGLPPLGRLPFGLQFTSGHVRDMVLDSVIENHGKLRLPGCGWSRLQVREVVRAIMYAQLALRRFSDTSEFVGDLGID